MLIKFRENKKIKSLVGNLFFLVGFLILCSTLIGVYVNYSPVPWWDQWYGVIGWYLRLNINGLSEFWALHNEHRIVFSRLIYLIDIKYFNGVNIFSIFSNVLLSAFLSLLLYVITSRNLLKADRYVKLLVAGFIVSFCFSWLQSDNLLWGFQNLWYAELFFSLAGFYALNICVDKNYNNKWFIISMITGLAATLTMVNGLLIWPIIFIIAIYKKFPLRLIVSIFVLALIIYLAYLWKSPEVTGSIPAAKLSYASPHYFLNLSLYFLRYVGSPAYFAYNSTFLATACGAIVLFLTAMSFRVFLINNRAIGLPLFLFLIFLLLSAAATAYGRLVFGLDNVFQGRHVTNALVIWGSLLLFCYLNFKNIFLRCIVLFCLSFTMVTIVYGQLKVLNNQQEILFGRLQSAVALKMGVYDHDYLNKLYDHDDYVKEVSIEAKKNSLSIFGDSIEPLKNPPLIIYPSVNCLGNNRDFVEKTSTPGIMKVGGWVYSDKNKLTSIVITDLQNRTIGQGVIGGYRPDVAKSLSVENQYTGWAAFFYERDNFLSFARMDDGRYCKIN